MATTTKSKLHPSKIDLSEATREKVVACLNETLATTFDLYSQVKQAHWNVKGPHFIALHEFFDTLAAELIDFVDTIAERATALAGTANGTVRLSAANSLLKEYPLDITGGEDHLAALAKQYALYAKHVRAYIDTTDEIGDADTADLYTELSRAADKALWFIESHLQ